MITPPSSAEILLYSQPTDMRKSFDGLAGLVRRALGREPNDGSYFLFVNRRRDRIKVLYWDRDGLALWYKRLEAGTFEMLPTDDGDAAVRIDSRHRDGPDAFLIETGYEGVLLGDCYSGYTGISHRSSEAIQHACVAHARRKVFEARDNHPVHASNLLAMLQELYDIEDRGKGLDAVGLLELRQSNAAAVWHRMRTYLDSDAIKKVLPKEASGKAIGYLSNHWDALQTYISNPQIPIDNNETEQLMKQVAVGRRNWLFIGSIAASERAANLLTLVSGAVWNDLDVWAYVKAVLDALLGTYCVQ